MRAAFQRIAMLAIVGITTLGAGLYFLRMQTVEGQVKDRPAKQSKTRQEFARAMAKVKEGMAEKDVLALLGKPDDIQTDTDPGGVGTHIREIWSYGTDGHLTFATLGHVYIDDKGRVQDVYGGRGEPPNPALMPEKELRPLLRLIDKAPSFRFGNDYDPLLVIQIVNALQPLGKEKALAAIEEYLRVAGALEGEGVFWYCACYSMYQQIQVTCLIWMSVSRAQAHCRTPNFRHAFPSCFRTMYPF